MSAESIRLRVEVEGDGIIVTMSGTAFRVIYRKQAHTTGLVASTCVARRALLFRRSNFSLALGSSPTTRRESSAGLCRSLITDSRKRAMDNGKRASSYSASAHSGKPELRGEQPGAEGADVEPTLTAQLNTLGGDIYLVPLSVRAARDLLLALSNWKPLKDALSESDVPEPPKKQ